MDTKRKSTPKRNDPVAIAISDIYLRDFSVTRIDLKRFLPVHNAPKGRLSVNYSLSINSVKYPDGESAIEADFTANVDGSSINSIEDEKEITAFKLTIVLQGVFVFKSGKKKRDFIEQDERVLAEYISGVMYPMSVSTLNQNISLMGYKSATINYSAHTLEPTT